MRPSVALPSSTDLNFSTVSDDTSFSLFFFFSSESSLGLCASGVPLFERDTKKDSLEGEEPLPSGIRCLTQCSTAVCNDLSMLRESERKSCQLDINDPVKRRK